eukprot:343899_1
MDTGNEDEDSAAVVLGKSEAPYRLLRYVAFYYYCSICTVYVITVVDQNQTKQMMRISFQNVLILLLMDQIITNLHDDSDPMMRIPPIQYHLKDMDIWIP